MSFEHKPDTGSIFRNDDKVKDSQPDYKGSGKFFGRECWIAAWINESNGKKYMSIKVEEKEDKQLPTGQPEPPVNHGPDPDDELPF